MDQSICGGNRATSQKDSQIFDKSSSVGLLPDYQIDKVRTVTMELINCNENKDYLGLAGSWKTQERAIKFLDS